MIIYREANAEELHTIAELLAKSFRDYPFFDLFMSSQKKEQLFTDIHALNTKSYFKKHVVLVAIREETIVAAALLKHRDRRDVGLFGYVAAGGLSVALKGGPAFLRDFLSVANEAKAAVERLEKPVWYLESLVVDPSQQGQRLGSKLLNDGIIPYIAKNDGGPLTLITNIEINRTFYKKNGFEEINAKTIKRNGHSVNNWSFKKEI
ncbi:GNAT family N-acetyltransferase [Shouchella patagoniensis]|uniref:GNAT family N-acetyltransferase n=1 Tax=Shouchella patagoniensis TaxID=228576 RepID=UPI000995BC5E|nr:GNAT family N-acetyltransferase [Shouchella patagoniensis]